MMEDRSSIEELERDMRRAIEGVVEDFNCSSMDYAETLDEARKGFSEIEPVQAVYLSLELKTRHAIPVTVVLDVRHTDSHYYPSGLASLEEKLRETLREKGALLAVQPNRIKEGDTPPKGDYIITLY